MLYPKEKLEQLTHRWTTAKGKRLLVAIKKSHCYLSATAFREKIKGLSFIDDEEVRGAVDLRGAPLAGFDFRVSIQEGDDGFIEEMAVLSDVHFEGANLKHCNFIDGKILNCNFENANLSHADFHNSSITDCSFEEAEMVSVNFNAAKIFNCVLSNAGIRDVVLASTIVDERTHFGKKLKSETEGNFHAASIEYKQIKEMYKNSSLHNHADFYHYKEMVAKRKTKKLSSPNRWLNYFFGDLICKYGISYVRVFFWSLVVILLFAGLLVAQNGLAQNGIPIKASLPDAIYFSLVTFTTLGYGDFHAIGNMRFLAGAESFIGVILMSLFTVIVARKIIRD
ncbi:pentapeptide repeat-containing protein [Candidatus Peregrinibacteria bacterium]|nr:pentapeptide repeat-containing protein [Candidatus Peregrinibacteria bacterium]